MVTRHHVDGTSLLGERLTSGSAPKAYELGRQCQESGCGVLLSRYNSTDWCARHEGALSVNGRPPPGESDPSPRTGR